MFEQSDAVDAHLCAAAADERSPLCSGLVAAFDGVDLKALGDTAAVDAAKAADRVVNRFTAVRLQAIATTVAHTRGTTRIEPERRAAGELAAVLRLGTRSIDREIGYALELTGRLQRTWRLMHSGDLAYGKARLLVDETVDLSDEKALKVETAVLDQAAGRTWSQHAAAVRRAVVRVDPTAPERRRKAAERAAGLMRRYSSDGLADLIVRLPAAQVEMAYTAADGWARARKAAGDERSLEVLRAEAIARWASSYLTHGDPTTCDTVCDPVSSPVEVDDTGTTDREPPAVPEPRSPMRHGRPLGTGLVWDLSSLLGLDDTPGELIDSGEVVSAADMRALVAGGIHLRRMLVDVETGELVDLTPGSWLLPPEATAGESAGTPAHGEPMWLGVIVDVATWEGCRDGTLTGHLATAVTLAPQAIRDMLAAPRTDHLLDGDPCAPAPSAALAEFVALRDRHPTNPCAAPSAAAAGDADHLRLRATGGPTTRGNLHSPTRRWHLLRTEGGWTVRRDRHGRTVWRSPQGRVYRTGPYDYRRGP